MGVWVSFGVNTTSESKTKKNEREVEETELLQAIVEQLRISNIYLSRLVGEKLTIEDTE